MIPYLPREIVQQILDHLEFEDVKFFNRYIPPEDPLKRLLEEKLYKKVLIGSWYYFPAMHNVKGPDQFESIILKGIPIKELYIDGPMSIIEGSIKRHPEYFSGVTSIQFLNPPDVLEIASILLMKTLVRISMRSVNYLLRYTHFGNLNLECVSFSKYDGEVVNSWPSTLKRLELIECDLSKFVLPDTLQEFECMSSYRGEDWQDFPSNLKKMRIFFNYSFEIPNYPEGLVSLSVKECELEDAGKVLMQWPSTLETLELANIDFSGYSDVTFPCQLKTLDIEGLDLIENLRFPDRLSRLHLHGRKIRYKDLKSLPTSLESLLINCDTVKGSPFPPGLTTLILQTSKFLNNTRFPPNLETFNLYFTSSQKESLCFTFPSCLRIFSITCSARQLFELNLPRLEVFTMVNCCGAVPPSVKDLTLDCDMDWIPFKSFRAPYGVRKLSVFAPLKEYPDSILDLTIKGFRLKDAPPFPQNLRYLRLPHDHVRISELQLPFSVQLVEGRTVWEDVELPRHETQAIKRTKDRCVLC